MRVQPDVTFAASVVLRCAPHRGRPRAFVTNGAREPAALDPDNECYVREAISLSTSESASSNSPEAGGSSPGGRVTRLERDLTLPRSCRGKVNYKHGVQKPSVYGI